MPSNAPTLNLGQKYTPSKAQKDAAKRRAAGNRVEASPRRGRSGRSGRATGPSINVPKSKPGKYKTSVTSTSPGGSTVGVGPASRIYKKMDR